MSSTRRLLGLGLVAATMGFAGCAPVASTWGNGPGLQLGISPGGTLNLFNSQCSLMGSPSYGSPFMSSSNAASVVMARMQQVNQIQAKFQLASVGAQSRESWKAIAGGGC